MSEHTLVLLVFGSFAALALIMLVRERRGIAKRKAARGGREIDVADVLLFGPSDTQGVKSPE